MKNTADSMSTELELWLSQMPGDVNPQVEAVRQRIGRLGRQFDRLLADVAAAHSLTVGDWAALSALHRATPGGSSTPKELADALGVTSGTMSVRIERLIRSGLVESVAAEDQRSRPVQLTDRGRDAWRSATAERTRREAEIVTGRLSNSQVAQLDQLLGRLLAGIEATSGTVSRHDIPRGP